MSIKKGRVVNHAEVIIEAKDVSFSYGVHLVLERATIEIHRGDYLAIVGGNGSGKTTLIKVLLGLLSPEKGEVRLFGKSPQEFREWKKIGYVRQHATNVDSNVPATAGEVALMGRYARRGPGRRMTSEDHEKIREALEEVGMWEHRDEQMGSLSGGQQQRVLIARALAGEPEILFLDEPTVGVDKETRENFYALLKHLNEEHQLTVVLITHDVEKIAHEAMHVACIDRTIFFHNSVDEYFKSTHIVTHPHA